MKKIPYLISIISFLLIGINMTSCKKESQPEKDIRDDYVGTWNYKAVGNITFYESGNVLLTLPINETETAEVTKKGDNGLMIGDQLFFVNGTQLTSDPESVNETLNGLNIVGTRTATGELGSNIITINSNLTGTWSSQDGRNGNLTGTMLITLTK